MVRHIGRVPESVVYRDRDIISVVPITHSVGIFDDQSQTVEPTPPIVSMSVLEMGTDVELYNVDEEIVGGERFLGYYRTLQDGTISNGIHACFWIFEENDTVCHYFREVISPRLTYDPDSSVITMMFWTNFKDKATLYESDNVVKVSNEHKYDPTILSYPTLCVSYGTVQKFSVVGGGADAAAQNGPDIVPVFRRPVVVYQNSQTFIACSGEQEPPVPPIGSVPIFDFNQEIVLYRAIADEDEGSRTIQVKTCDVLGHVCAADDVITLRTIDPESTGTIEEPAP